MARQPGDDPSNDRANLPVLEGRVETRSGPRPLSYDDPDHPDPTLRPQLTYRERMFDIGWTGWVRLATACLAVGVLLSLAQINVFDPGFTIGGALGQLVDGVLRGVGWLISTGWQPFLLGVLVVIPLWLMWRAVYALFRR